MSEFTTIRDDIEAPFEKIAQVWEGSTIGEAIDTAVEADIKELEAISPALVEKAAAATATSMLPGILADNYAAALTAGVETAIAEFKAGAIVVSDTALTTFANTVGGSVKTTSSGSGVSS